MNYSNPKVGIVIVNYNGEKYQQDCLRTIREQTYQNFEIIIVDSGSSDHSVELAKQEFPEAHFLLQTENVGVAKGNNIGIRYSKNLGMDCTLLLNNDVELAPDLLEKLIKKVNKKTITVPKIYYYTPGSMLWYAGGQLRWDRADAEHWGNFKLDTGQYDVEKNVTYSPTCCMLIPNSVFDTIGDEDELFFMYFDDTDLCARICEAGFEIKYIPTAKLWHKVSSSGGGMDSKIYVYYVHRNKLYFIRKYKNKLKFPARLYTHIKAAAKFLLSPVYKKNNKYIWLAYKDYCKGQMGRRDW